MFGRSRFRQLRLLLLVLLVSTDGIAALKCRSVEGPSNADLKRTVRVCMRKVGELAWQHSNGNGNGRENGNGNVDIHSPSNTHPYTNSHYSPGQRRTNYYYDPDSYYNNNYENHDDVADSETNYKNPNNHNNHFQTNNYDILKQRNRDRDRERERERDRMPSNRNDRIDRVDRNGRTTHTKAPTNNHNGVGHSHNSPNNSQQNVSNTNHGKCVAHCFFEEMKMLNNEDYPDRHKVNYLMVKDLRDRELRNFYSETIEECFRYLDTQRRYDKCQFSQQLVSCMTEYAKANCDDWQEYNMIFN